MATRQIWRDYSLFSVPVPAAAVMEGLGNKGKRRIGSLFDVYNAQERQREYVQCQSLTNLFMVYLIT